MVATVIRQTLIQMQTPDEMRGRVFSVNSLFYGTSIADRARSAPA